MNVTSGLLERYKEEEDPKDLEEAIEHLTKASKLSGLNHSLRLNIQNSIGLCFLERYRCFGKQEDLDAFSKNIEQVIRLTWGHSDRQKLHDKLDGSLTAIQCHQVDDESM